MASRIDNATRKKVVSDYKKGYSLAEIANRWELSTGSVSGIVVKARDAGMVDGRRSTKRSRKKKASTRKTTKRNTSNSYIHTLEADRDKWKGIALKLMEEKLLA